MNPRALIVEDDGAYAFMLHRQFERYLPGWEIVIAPTMHEALSICQRSSVRLIILDLGLPDSTPKNSIDCIVALSGNAPVVVMTGAEIRETPTFTECFMAGAEEVWEKQSMRSEEGVLLFINSIHSALARHAARNQDAQRT